MIKKTILAIDDSMIVVKQLKSILDRTYNFIGANSGLAGLKILDDVSVDLIMLDLEMPIMDGFSTLEAIKQKESAKDIPVVILTGNNQKQNVIKGIISGVAGYIVKPADSETLLKKLNDILGEDDIW